MKMKILWGLACALLLIGSAMAIDFGPREKPLYYEFVPDSGYVVTLDVDTLVTLTATKHIREVYLPSEVGAFMGWANQYLLAYGISDIDSSSTTKTKSLKEAMDDDSATCGFILQSQIDAGSEWITLLTDTTITYEIANGPDNDSTIRYSSFMYLNTMIPNDTVAGPYFRLKCILTHDVDSTDDIGAMHDTITLPKIKFWGF